MIRSEVNSMNDERSKGSKLKKGEPCVVQSLESRGMTKWPRGKTALE